MGKEWQNPIARKSDINAPRIIAFRNVREALRVGDEIVLHECLALDSQKLFDGVSLDNLNLRTLIAAAGQGSLHSCRTCSG